METLSKEQVDELFRREAVLIGTEDAVPAFRAAALFGEGAVEHAKILGHWNSYSARGSSIAYITRRGFQAAASACNVMLLRKEDCRG